MLHITSYNKENSDFYLAITHIILIISIIIVISYIQVLYIALLFQSIFNCTVIRNRKRRWNTRIWWSFTSSLDPLLYGGYALWILMGRLLSVNYSKLK